MQAEFERYDGRCKAVIAGEEQVPNDDATELRNLAIQARAEWGRLDSQRGAQDTVWSVSMQWPNKLGYGIRPCGLNELVETL